MPKTNGFGSPSSLPITYVVDSDGVVRTQLTPDKTAVTAKSLDEAVLPLLKNRAAINLPNGSKSSSAEAETGGAR